MYSLVKIYQGNLKNQNNEAFRFTVKDYKKVCGAFCTGGTYLSLAFDNERDVMLRSFEQREMMDVPPNKRPVFFKRNIEMDIIKGVITKKGTFKPKDVFSVYLIMQK
ncbi:MAG: hypothetical protein A2W91_05550 [Bacteroidetes bacterium GWF2_38_335]|nr:MAG: hypothetical protein A2W91_05550 [Bacteroidetes bacterium GWF2_38_335]HBS88091.1 hypothetical protein [Bacteroidales bacterium]